MEVFGIDKNEKWGYNLLSNDRRRKAKRIVDKRVVDVRFLSPGAVKLVVTG